MGMPLLTELKQRKLVQWALAYVAAAFALLQGVDMVSAKFGWSNTVGRTLILVAVLGLFVVLLLAWYHGERGAQKVSGTELALLTLLFAIGGTLIWKFGPAEGEEKPGSDHSSGAQAAAGTRRGSPELWSDPGFPPAASKGRKSIAVLPFENLSGDPDNAYFASGMQDMILTKLAAIGELKVISRTSTERYASHPGNLKEIAQQLGVGTVLEGSVQKAGNAVLINVQLIDAATDEHLWAEAYPRTLDNIFGVEGEVAQKIADALRAKLTMAESASMARVPTQNPAAYEAFLKAEYLLEQARRSWQPETFAKASAEYRRSIELDPGFALAHARMAYCYLSQHWFFKRLSGAELAEVKASVDRALALSPEDPDAHLALAFFHYWGFREYEAATAEFHRTLQLSPNRSEAWSGLAFIARRTSRVSESLQYSNRAIELSPRDARLLGESGWTHLLLRNYAEADRELRQSLAIAPDDGNILDALLKTRLFGFGDASIGEEILGLSVDWRIVGNNNLGGDVAHLLNVRAYALVFGRRYADALREWETAPSRTDYERRSARVARVVIRMLAGGVEQVRDECKALEAELAPQLAADPEAFDLLQHESWMQACLGRRNEALAAARKSVDTLPMAKDSYFGAYQLVGLAQIAAQVGAHDQALDVIDELMALPAGQVMSISRLRLDPVFDPLRENARFEALLKRSGP